MNRNAFKQLLKRYVAGTANDKEKALINHWYELLYNDNITTLNEQELNFIEQEIWDKIELEGNFPKKTITPAETPIRTIIFRWAAAAAILIGVSFGIYGLFSSPQKSVAYQQSKEKQKLTEVINTSPEVKKVQLEDGTIITLQPSSRLAYPNRFASDKREIYLEGEAFFKVAKNPVKPFLVHTGNLVTQVLGTSFTIKPDKETNKIIVSVKTGRVAVFEDNSHIILNNDQKKNNGTIITPNQSVIYDAASRNFTTLLVDNPEPVMSDSNRIVAPALFAFDETDLATVLENVGKMYAIDIMVENENIYHCRFTGDITRQSLYEKLDLICQSTNHQYEIKGTKILIKGKGCN
jgi:ferric-dicitrate binding protein FerR (iron transport regulator)